MKILKYGMGFVGIIITLYIISELLYYFNIHEIGSIHFGKIIGTDVRIFGETSNDNDKFKSIKRLK